MQEVFSNVRPWDKGMMIQDRQDRPDSQKTIPHHPLVFGRGHFLSMESGHESFYTLSPNTILLLSAISSLDQEMGGLGTGR